MEISIKNYYKKSVELEKRNQGLLKTLEEMKAPKYTETEKYQSRVKSFKELEITLEVRYKFLFYLSIQIE